MSNTNSKEQINQEQKEYWISRLGGEIQKSSFPYDKTCRLKDIKLKEERFSLADDIYSKLIKISNSSDLRLYIILTSALISLLSKYCRKSDIIFGSPLYKNIEESCTNEILPIRNEINGKRSFKELVIQVSQSIKEANENSNYSIKSVVESLELDSSEEECSLFDLIILLENIHDVNSINKSNYNMIFNMNRTSDCVDISILYNCIIYNKETITRIKCHFINFLNQVINNIDTLLDSVHILSEEEVSQIVYKFNDTRVEFPENITIQELFEKRVEENLESIAVVYEDKKITYYELNKKSNQLALLLRKKGVVQDTIVGFIIDRSLDMIIGLLGILKAGGAYLPIDPESPNGRVIDMIRECGTNIILTNTSTIEEYSLDYLTSNMKYEELLNQETVVNSYSEKIKDGIKTEIIKLDKIDEILLNMPCDNLCHVTTPTDLAYVMFTSGSTGRPKGVMIEHRSAINTINWFGKTSKLKEGTNVLLTYNYTSDPSVEDIFATLIFGSTLHVTDKYLLMEKDRFQRFVNENKINIFNFVPRAIKELFTETPKLESLDIILSGGEELEENLKNELLEKGYTVYNDYGPTEATIDCMSEKCSLDQVTIGRAIDNMNCYILDKYNNIQPIGVMGELCISGAGVARGYINRPDITAERFITDPFRPGQRMYRTGDMAKWLPNGTVQYIDRIDNQVKIRGYRIELSEIEILLRNHKDINDSVVIVCDDGKGEKCLCAYIVYKNKLNIDDIKDYLLKRLPRYMMPSFYVEIDRIPLSSIGKVDKKKLPKPKNILTSNSLKDKLINNIESNIYDIFRATLEVDEISIDDNFFDIGANSLSIINIGKKLNEQFGIDLPIVSLFKYSTIRMLSQYIEHFEINKERIEALDLGRVDVISEGKNKITERRKKMMETRRISED